MDGEELGGTFVISVDELGLNGLWSTIKDLVESRMPLQGLTLPNKVGKIVGVPRLPLMFVVSSDKRLLRLKQYSHSPVTWFRNPHTHLILVSTADVHEYKSTTRAQLKRVTADVEKDWGGAAVGSEWVILYVRPFEMDPSDKAAKKVFEKLCDDFGSKRRERVVRLDVPLRAFDAPSASSLATVSHSSSRSVTVGYTPLPSSHLGYGPVQSSPAYGSSAATGTAQGGMWGSGATGLDDLCAGLRDSIRAAFEARQSAYDAEVRKLLNERRDPKWSFTTLYLVKDSFALMLEGAGLWEDAFQEYVELETVYFDCLDTTAAAAAPATRAEAAAAAVREAADFGLTGSDTEDVSSLLSSSWRNMRRLVLWKKSVQEFHFRQYLFAAQARVLLRLGRPVDVAERGLVFIQNFLALLAAREAAGQIKPWFKECWAFSACMALIGAITAYTAQRHSLPADWDVTDSVTAQGSGPQGPAAAAAVRQLAAAVAAERSEKAAAAGEGAKGSSTRRSTESDKTIRPRGINVPGSPPALTIQTSLSSSSSSTSAAASGSSSSSSSVPVLTAAEWELEYPREGFKGSGATAAAAAAAAAEEEEDVPPLDTSVLCGQAITPGNAGLLLAGEQRKELTDKLYNCLLGHLYHLARGELLRLGSALRLTEAAAAAAGGNASIMQLGKSAFAPAAAAGARSTTAAAAGSSSSSSTPTKSKVGGSTAAGAGSGQTQSNIKSTSGVDLVTAAAAAGSLNPRIVAQLQDLLLTPVCGFSQMITKYPDGSGEGLTYEVHTPRYQEDPLAAALARRDSHSLSGALRDNSSSSNAHSPNATSPAAASSSSNMFDRLRRGGSSHSGTSAAAAAPVQQQAAHSRLSRATAEDNASAAAAAAAAAAASGGSSSGGGIQRADSTTSLATVNISSGGDAPATAAELAAANGSSSMTDTAAAAAGSSAGNAGGIAAAAAAGPVGNGTAVPSLTASAGSLSGGTGQRLRDLDSIKASTHTRSVSALPAGAGHSGSSGPAAAAASGGGVMISPRSLEGLVDPGAMVPSGSSILGRAAAAAAAATGGLSLVHPAAAASAAAAVPSWVGEWRLQLALRSPAAYQELLLSLSRRAARCYAKAGRVRSSALIYADVAVLAMQRGHLEHAARLLERMQQIFTCENWQLLLGVLLPKLLAVQRLADQPLLPFTALSLLSLPPAAAAAADRQAAFEELLITIGSSSADQDLDSDRGPGFGNNNSTLHPGSETVSNGVLYDSPRSKGLAGGGVGFGQQQQQQQQHQQFVQLATHAALQLRPASGTYSHFFGNEVVAALGKQQDATPQQQQPLPVLSPPARAPGTAAAAGYGSKGGAALLVVGDSVSLTVDMVSTLPGPIQLRQLVLSLAQLHKNAWMVASGGNSIFGSAGDLSTTGAGSSSSSLNPGPNLLDSRSDQGFGAARDSLGFSRVAGLGFRDRDALGSSDSPRVGVQRWQEGEELLSNKLVTAYSPATSSDTDSSSSSGCRLTPNGSVIIVPGVNRLVFQVAPMRQGLYCLKQLRAQIGTSAELVAGLPPPESLSLIAAAAAAGSSTRQQQQQQRDPDLPDQICTATSDLYLDLSHSRSGSTTEAVQIGGVTPTGSVVSKVIVAQVVGPSPRLRLSPILCGGCLPVGCTAWLGVLISPLHDVILQRPKLHVFPSKLLCFASTGDPRALVSSSFSFQQGLGSLGGSSESVTDQQQQQQQQQHSGSASLLNKSISFGGGSSSQAHPQAAHWVYVMQLKQHALSGSPLPTAAAGSGDLAAAAAECGCWVRVSRGGAVDLSEVLGAGGSLRGPLLLWMQVLVGSPTHPPATVKVAAPQLPPPLTAAAAAAAGSANRSSAAATDLIIQQQPQTPTAAATAAAAAAAAAGTKCIPEPGILLSSRSSATSAEIALQIEYMSGVFRSHSCNLLLPLQQPAAVAAAAIQLASGVLALNITITLESDLASGLLLLEADIRPQYGLCLGGSSSSSTFGSSGGLGGLSQQGSNESGFGDILPMRVLPGGSAGLCYVLTRDPGDKSTGSFEADGSSLLTLTYALEPAHNQEKVTDPVTGDVLPQPPSAAAAAAAVGQDPAAAAAAGSNVSAATAAAEAVAAGRVMHLKLPFWLEFPCASPAAATAASLKAVLLGPFQGFVGQPMSLTWQISRTQQTPKHKNNVNNNNFTGLTDISLSDGLGGSTNSEYDEVLCFDVIPGSSISIETLRSSSQGLAALGAARASGQGFSGLNRAQTLNPGDGVPWWEGCKPSGSVRLGRAVESLATVEVVLVPRMAGRQVAPRLNLRSLGGNQPLVVEWAHAAGEDDSVIWIQP